MKNKISNLSDDYGNLKDKFLSDNEILKKESAQLKRAHTRNNKLLKEKADLTEKLSIRENEQK